MNNHTHINEGDSVRIVKGGRYWRRWGRVIQKESDPHEKTVYIVGILHRRTTDEPTIRPAAFWREELELIERACE